MVILTGLLGRGVIRVPLRVHEAQSSRTYSCYCRQHHLKGLYHGIRFCDVRVCAETGTWKAKAPSWFSWRGHLRKLIFQISHGEPLAVFGYLRLAHMLVPPGLSNILASISIFKLGYRKAIIQEIKVSDPSERIETGPLTDS